MTTKKQIKALIGDDSAEFGMAWARALISKGMYAVTRRKNGEVLLETLKEADRYDVVIIEAKMPGLDAVQLLQEINKLDYKPEVVVIANYDSPQLEREVMEAGAKYYMVKPFEARVLAERVARLTEDDSAAGVEPIRSFGAVSYNIHETVPDNIEYVVTDIIHQIGIPAHIKGYHYLRTAILLAVEDSDMINNITRMLYPTVAKKYETTSSRVERAIRHAIEIAWDRGNVDTLNAFFGYTIHTAKGKPTNSEFIALIADKLKLRFKNRGSLTKMAI